MPSLKNNVQKIKEKSNVVAHSSTSNSVIETLARIGYVARGAIYFVIGLTALLFASGNGGKTTDPQGAIATIGNQPAGRIFLWIVLFGVICYSLWGFIRAIFNPLHAEHNTKGIAERIGYFFSAIAYALLVRPYHWWRKTCFWWCSRHSNPAFCCVGSGLVFWTIACGVCWNNRSHYRNLPVISRNQTRF